MLTELVDDRKLSGISTKVSDRAGIPGYFDGQLVNTGKMRFNRLKKSFEEKQNDFTIL